MSTNMFISRFASLGSAGATVAGTIYLCMLTATRCNYYAKTSNDFLVAKASVIDQHIPKCEHLERTKAQYEKIVDMKVALSKDGKTKKLVGQLTASEMNAAWLIYQSKASALSATKVALHHKLNQPVHDVKEINSLRTRLSTIQDFIDENHYAEIFWADPLSLFSGVSYSEVMKQIAQENKSGLHSSEIIELKLLLSSNEKLDFSTKEILEKLKSHDSRIFDTRRAGAVSETRRIALSYNSFNWQSGLADETRITNQVVEWQLDRFLGTPPIWNTNEQYIRNDRLTIFLNLVERPEYIIQPIFNRLDTLAHRYTLKFFQVFNSIANDEAERSDQSIDVLLSDRSKLNRCVMETLEKLRNVTEGLLIMAMVDALQSSLKSDASTIDLNSTFSVATSPRAVHGNDFPIRTDPKAIANQLLKHRDLLSLVTFIDIIRQDSARSSYAKWDIVKFISSTEQLASLDYKTFRKAGTGLLDTKSYVPMNKSQIKQRQKMFDELSRGL